MALDLFILFLFGLAVAKIIIDKTTRDTHNDREEQAKRQQIRERSRRKVKTFRGKTGLGIEWVCPRDGIGRRCVCKSAKHEDTVQEAEEHS